VFSQSVNEIGPNFDRKQCLLAYNTKLKYQKKILSHYQFIDLDIDHYVFFTKRSLYDRKLNQIKKSYDISLCIITGKACYKNLVTIRPLLMESNQMP
jgi:hypothetical protein